MIGGDMALGWVSSDGIVHLQDRHSIGAGRSHGGPSIRSWSNLKPFPQSSCSRCACHFPTGLVQPALDKVNNLCLFRGRQTADGWTEIEFSRKADTCDDQDMSIRDQTLRLIWYVASSGDKRKRQSLTQLPLSTLILISPFFSHPPIPKYHLQGSESQ